MYLNILSKNFFKFQVALVIQEWNLKQDSSTTISILVNGHYEILKCLVDSRRVIWELSYPMALLSLQILISPLIVRSRRNYKEGLLFCCGSVSVLFVWIGWITAFMLFDEGQDPAWQDITICSGLVATPTVLLLVIFIPKVCVICFHEKKNLCLFYSENLFHEKRKNLISCKIRNIRNFVFGLLFFGFIYLTVPRSDS